MSQPSVWELNLNTVLDPLLEHAMLVANAIAPSGQIESGHRVQEASGQAAKTTVSECSIFLLLNKILYFDA